MEKVRFGLMNILEGYVRNYRRFNFNTTIKTSASYTLRELEYFAQVGECLGFYIFFEDGKPNKNSRSRPMDLSWRKWDGRINDEEFSDFVLHLERENRDHKDVDTIDKLFADTGDFPRPQCVIGLQCLRSPDRIEFLNGLVLNKNKRQKSNVLMIYRFYDKVMNFDRVWAYHFDEQGLVEERKIISDTDSLGYWYMCFEEEYES